MSLPNKFTFRSLLENSNRLYQDLPALSYVDEKALTYGEVNKLATNLSDSLAAKGIKKGDRVAILSQNMPNWGVAYLAITRMGAVVVPILVDFSNPEIEKILGHSEAKVILVSEKMVDKLHQPLPQTLKSAFLIDDLGEISVSDLEIRGKAVKCNGKINNLPPKSYEPEENDLVAILYTSGTTGSPKGVMLSHGNIISSAVNTLGIQDVNTKDRLLSVLPLPHTYECTIGFVIPFMRGATVYYLDKLPTPTVLLPAMEKVKPTMMLTVPLIIEKVYQNKVLPKLTGSAFMRSMMKVKTLRKFLHKMAGKKIYKAFGGHLHFFGIGGAKLGAPAELFLRDAGFPYAIGYGLTETSPLLAGCNPKLTRYRSTGFCLPNQQLKINNPDPKTGEGEILAKGPNVMMGYYKDEEQTQQVFTPDGWFKTGDLGVMDNDGYLYIRGRLKNMILSPSGENIYPEDIEAVLNSQQYVQESLVYEMKGKLIAKVHLNYEELEKKYQHLKATARNFQEELQQKARERLHEIREKANANLSRFSRLNTVEEQTVPFEKTPTKKIKRFLYFKSMEEN